MATLHTNFLTGNDTTGDGSASLPYKTINKALSVAIDADLIKVAGGEIVQVAGATVTTTARGTTMTTSTDLTTQFAIGDSIFLQTTDGYPVIANGLVITTINATTITLATESACHMAPGTYNVFKLSTYHYATFSGTFETFTAPTANNVTIEGGWDATFTTQIGWTGIKCTASTASASFTSTWSFVKPNIVWNKFLFSNIASALVGSNASIGINEVVFNRTAVPFGTSNFGVYAPSSVGFTTIYSYGSVLIGTWNGAGNRPDTLLIKQWTTATIATNSRDAIKVGNGTTIGLTTGPTIRSLQCNWRSLGSAINFSTFGVIAGAGSAVGDIFIDQLNLYIGGSAIHGLIQNPGNASAWRYVADINTINIDGTRCGIMPFSTGGDQNILYTSSDGPLNINRTSGRLDELLWIGYGSYPATAIIASCQRSPIYGKDIEGQKIINNDLVVKFADPTEYVTGSNSMRYRLITNTSGGDTFRYFCGILSKPTSTASFTITVKMKASKAITIGGNSNIIELVYGPSVSKVINGTPSTNSITTSWQDVTFTIDPTTVTDWNFGNDGLMQVVIPIGSGVVGPSEVAYLWVDSVTVS